MRTVTGRRRRSGNPRVGEGPTGDVDQIVTGRRNDELAFKLAWSIDGGLMIGEEASGRYAANGRFENVPQTEQLERPSRERQR